MSLPNGTYRTKNGSEVVISGKHSGISTVTFDWLEEDNACCDCQPEPYPESYEGKFWLVWHCEVCDGGCAELFPESDQRLQSPPSKGAKGDDPKSY